MPKRPRDSNQLAHLIGDIATGQVADTPAPEKDAGAIARGKKGGPARAEKLSPERRAEIAKQAADSRWTKSKA